MPRDPRGRRAYPVDVEEEALQRVELRGGDGEQARVAVQRGARGTDIRVVRVRGEVEEGGARVRNASGERENLLAAV